MKKSIFILLLSMVACNPSTPEGTKSVHRGVGPGSYNMDVVIVDSCEYIVTNRVNSISVVHKANCKNH